MASPWLASVARKRACVGPIVLLVAVIPSEALCMLVCDTPAIPALVGTANRREFP